MLTVRSADASDLEAIVELTRRRRAALAQWSPTWWRPAPASDAIHRRWLSDLLDADDAACRVVVDDGATIGCAIAVRRGERWLIDDVAVAHTSHWPAFAAALAHGMAERPALSCVPTADTGAVHAFEAAGLLAVSSYWIVRAAPDVAAASFVPLVGDAQIGPPHTFEPLLAPALAMRLTCEGGVAVASGSVPAPPIYDPGGTVRIIDRVRGPDPNTIIRAALSAAHQAGDVLVCVVTAGDHNDLEHALQQVGAMRTVEVLAWP